MLIHTGKLKLLTMELSHLEALARGPQALGEYLKVSIPEGWPTLPDAYAQALKLLRREPLRAAGGWWLYLVLHAHERALVGSAGFKAPPQDGVVEIGCEIAPEFRGQGLGSEAVLGLVRYAFTRPEVRAVDACSLPGRNAAARMLEKAGLRKIDTAQDAQAGTVQHWRITAEQFLRAGRKAA